VDQCIPTSVFLVFFAAPSSTHPGRYLYPSSPLQVAGREGPWHILG